MPGQTEPPTRKGMWERKSGISARAGGNGKRAFPKPTTLTKEVYSRK
ncbi:MAG: hypothetical protein K5882_08570 [Bacteroidales bacterium]|nr:hypothetical protein [Bacteroidales bacterium]